MAKKVSRFQKFREDALALLDERALGSLAEFSNWHKFAHFWVLVWKSFTRNRCPVRAAALAYATGLALIPMLAVAISISSAILKKEVESVTTVATVNTNSPGVAPPMTAAVTNPPAPAGVAGVPAEATNSSVITGGGETNQTRPRSVAEVEEVVQTRKAISHYIHDFIQNTRSGALGVTGKMQFKEGSGDPIKSAVILQIKDGKFVWFANANP